MRELFRPYVLLLALPALLLAGCDMETPSDQPPPTTADVVINEFMASNASQGADENGEFDDWIELYNRGDAAIDLAGYTVTDNLGDPAKFTIESGHGAATTIQPGGFLMLWCDSTPDQGPLHTSFNLGAGGGGYRDLRGERRSRSRTDFPRADLRCLVRSHCRRRRHLGELQRPDAGRRQQRRRCERQPGHRHSVAGAGGAGRG
jgi:hypothetical protein